jgi:hypothetical protein
MLPSERLETAVWMVNQGVVFGAVVAAWKKGLYRDYRYFCLYLLLSSIASCVLFYFRNVEPHPGRYSDVFIAWGYLSPLFLFFAISELLRLTLGRFPAIETASRRVLSIFWCGLAVLGVAWYFYLVELSAMPFPLLKAGLGYQQSAATAFGLFVLLFLGFVAFMPVPMSKLKLTHSFLLGGLFLTLALSRLIYLLVGMAWARTAASYVGMAGSIVLIACWGWKMRVEGDSSELAVASGDLNREQALVYIERLEQLNATLAQSGPRFLR